MDPPPPIPSPDVSFHPTPTTPPGTSYPSKPPKKKKSKPVYVTPPPPPPKENLYTLDTNLNDMEGVVDLSVLPGAEGGVHSSSSPGSGFETSTVLSSSDVSSMQFGSGSVNTSQHSMFSNPNPFGPNSQRRLAPGALAFDGRRISPKARPPGVYQNGVGDGDSPSWTAPESWAVEKEGEDPLGQAYSSSDESVRGKSGRKRRKRATSSKVLYHVRIYRANNSYHVVQCGLDVTVSQLTPQLNKKLLLDPGVEPHRLYLKERGRGANLG